MKHIGQPGWRCWQPDDNQNQAYRQTDPVRRDGTTSDQPPKRLTRKITQPADFVILYPGRLIWGQSMSKPVPVTRLDRSASELRREASRCSDGAVVRRLLAIALVLEGRPRC